MGGGGRGVSGAEGGPGGRRVTPRATCRAGPGPEAGSWSCSIRFSFGNPTWRRSCCSRGSPDTTPSLPAEKGWSVGDAPARHATAAAPVAAAAPHHDVGRDDAGVVAHRLDEKDLRTQTTALRFPPPRRSAPTVVTATLTLKSFSAPKLRIMARLSRVVLVASKTWKEWR